MPKCTFCKQTYEFPRGLTLALNDGRLLYFCSSKCRKNFEMGRDNKKVRWVASKKRAETEEAEEKPKEPVK